MANMTLATARTWVRQFSRNAGDSSVYSDSDIDRAIKFAGSIWCQRTGNLVGVATMTVDADDSQLPTYPTGFRPDLLLSAWIGYSQTSQARPLEVISAEILQTLPTSSGVPYLVCFFDDGGQVYPTPSEQFIISVKYRLDFDTWTDGTASTVTFTLPDVDMFPIVQLGAPAILQSNEPEHAFTTVAWKRFEEAIARGVRLTLGPAYTQLDPYVPAPTIEEERELT